MAPNPVAHYKKIHLHDRFKWVAASNALRFSTCKARILCTLAHRAAANPGPAVLSKATSRIPRGYYCARATGAEFAAAMFAALAGS